MVYTLDTGSNKLEHLLRRGISISTIESFVFADLHKGVPLMSLMGHSVVRALRLHAPCEHNNIECLTFVVRHV